MQTTLVLQTTNFIFTAEKDTAGPNSFLGAIPIGSLVEVRGICLLESSDDGKIKSFRLLLPTSLDVRIIKKPGWLTPQAPAGELGGGFCRSAGGHRLEQSWWRRKI